jgi:hypothetical protein
VTRPPQRAAGRGRWPAGIALVIVALATAGCLGGMDQTPRPSDAAPAAASEGPSLEPSAAPPEGATPVASSAGPIATATAPSDPPDALLAGPTGGPVAGELGSFSWDGVVSDSPWIVPPTASPLDPARHLRVRVRGGPAVASWTARWAKVRNDEAGPPRLAGSGTGAPLAIDAPPGPGGWSLQVDIRFDGGGRAAWYWRVQVDR